MNTSQALANIPEGLRTPLIREYQSIVQNFSEHRWSPSELSGGLFCEIVFTILDGHAKGSFPLGPSKPSDFVGACRRLESNTHVPRSFQILIPRALPALYEVRNNRGVGHVGGDVDPNHMDATLVISICNWIMAELVRVFHSIGIGPAQKVVDALAEARTPLVWQGADVKRVLDPGMSLKDQVLVLIGTSAGGAGIPDLLRWTEYKNRIYFLKLLRLLHKKRFVELSETAGAVQILPPGAKYVAAIVAKRRPA